jgi:tetratricopeptide (TPR) repeat protein
LYEKRGKYPEAIAALEKALVQDPQRSDLFMEKARIYRVGMADFQKAIEAYRAAVDANKTAVTLDALGEGLYNAGDHLQAVRVLREAVDMDANYGPGLVHLGMALYARRNYEDSVANLEKGLALIGDTAREDYLYTAGLAHIYKEPRECDLAEPWLRKALEKNAESPAALAGLRICAGAEDPTTVNP